MHYGTLYTEKLKSRDQLIDRLIISYFKIHISIYTYKLIFFYWTGVCSRQNYELYYGVEALYCCWATSIFNPMCFVFKGCFDISNSSGMFPLNHTIEGPGRDCIQQCQTTDFLGLTVRIKVLRVPWTTLCSPFPVKYEWPELTNHIAFNPGKGRVLVMLLMWKKMLEIKVVEYQACGTLMTHELC